MKKGIICIETEWQITTQSNKRNINTEPLIRFLHELNNAPYIYRRVATREELRYYLKKFHNKEYNNYGIFYFSFHRDTHEIVLEGEKERISLSKLAEMSNGLFKNKYVHFSSCRTLLGSDNELQKFVEESGAKFVSGYTKSVDTDYSAIHDIALIEEILNSNRNVPLLKRMYKLYGGLEEKLGFKTSENIK